MEHNPFLARMEKMTDEQLRDVIWIQSEDYTNEALEAAKYVASMRGMGSADLQDDLRRDAAEAPESVPETFLDCLKSIDFKAIEKKLYGTFKESDRVVEELKTVYQNLMTLKPQASDPKVYLFIAQLTDEYVGRYPFDVFGIEEDSDEPFGLEMLPWNEWLGLTVYEKTRSFVTRLGMDEFVALCLKKMTVLGFTEEEIESKIDAMGQFEMELDDEEEDDDEA